MTSSATAEPRDGRAARRSPRASDGGPLPLIIETKLLPPLVRSDALVRAALVERVEESVGSHALTLVSTGPGFGKTSLLASWCASQPVPETVAWVTVDPADDDPVRLWAHIGEALRRTYRHRVQTASEPLTSSTVQIVGTLVNELAAARAPRVLVLDELHRISNPACIESLDAFIEAMPRKVRVVIASRTDPALALARLRARGELGELRAGDLAYTAAEARELVSGSGNPELGVRDAELLRRRTEGWPAGMYLALLAAGAHADPERFVEEFAGDTHVVADYLEGEVFATLDEETQSFLVRTSVLEELSGPVCDATLEIAGSAERLHELSHANLFLVPLDERGEWYRYHQLFRDMLQRRFNRLQPSEQLRVHRQASAWWSAVGNRPALAIAHALAGEDWAEAIRLILATALDAARKGRWVTVLGWISAIPEDQLDSAPVLPAFAASIAAALGHPWLEIEGWLSRAERARERFPDRWTPDAEGFALFPRAAFVGSDVGGCVAAARRLLKASEDGQLRNGAIAKGTLAWGLLLAGDLESARESAEAALADEAAAAWAGARTRAYAVLSLLALEAGSDQQALALAAEAIEAARETEAPGTAMTACASVAHALAMAAAGKLEEAEREVRPALQAPAPSKDASRAHALLALASIRRRRGRMARAQEALAAAERELVGFADAGRLPQLLEDQRGALAAADAQARGTEALSEAELGVLRLMATDKSQREIASALFLSPNTVKTHSRVIYRKLNVGSRADAVALAHDLSLLEERA